MINENRIVPVTATDLLTLYGTVLSIVDAFDEGNGVIALGAIDDKGDFAVTEDAISGVWIASEPVRSFDFGASVTGGMLYFIAAYDYVGFTAAGEAITPSGAVEADGRTLYQAEYASGDLTITKAGF